jgi:putative ABC transport system permease protein
VVGAEVADRLQYVLGQSLVIAHGGGSAAILDHADKPFRIAGILAATGTPVDRTVVVSLEGIEAMHAGWSAGVPVPSQQIDPEAARRMDLVPETVTAILVGLTSRVHTFKVQRLINEYPGEPLLAILPGIALQELWRIMGVAENALLGVSILVVLVGLGGMMTALLTSLNERRREIAILRSVGARPGHVVLLLATESVLLAAAGCLLGMVLLYGMQLAIGPWMADQWGILLSWRAPNPLEWGMLGAVLLAALLAGLVPGYRAYRYSLSDGLMVRT